MYLKHNALLEISDIQRRLEILHEGIKGVTRYGEYAGRRFKGSEERVHKNESKWKYQ